MPLSARQKDVIDAHAPEAMRPFLYRMAAKEGASGGTSSTGAKGLFQFTRGTGRAYGLLGKDGDIRDDDVANTRAMVRLTQDNSATMRRLLGREPTLSELALGHQQGAQTAASMILGTGNAPTRNLAVNNVDPNTPPQEAARQIMNYYGFDKKPPLTVAGMTPGLSIASNSQAFQTPEAAPAGSIPYIGAFTPPGVSLNATPVEAAAPPASATFAQRLMGADGKGGAGSPLAFMSEGADQTLKGIRNTPSPEAAAAAARIDPSSIGASVGQQQAAVGPMAQSMLTQMIQAMQKRRGM